MRMSKEFKKRSCLNEEYTRIIEEIDMHLREARELYNQLPSVIQDNTIGLDGSIGDSICEVIEVERSYGIIE